MVGRRLATTSGRARRRQVEDPKGSVMDGEAPHRTPRKKAQTRQLGERKPWAKRSGSRPNPTRSLGDAHSSFGAISPAHLLDPRCRYLGCACGVRSIGRPVDRIRGAPKARS